MKLFLSSQAISEYQAPHLIDLVGKPAKAIHLAADSQLVINGSSQKIV